LNKGIDGRKERINLEWEKKKTIFEKENVRVSSEVGRRSQRRKVPPSLITRA